LSTQIFDSIPTTATITGISIRGKTLNSNLSPKAQFHFETETGRTSANFFITPQDVYWNTGVTPFNKVTLKIEDPSLQVSFSDLELVVTYNNNVEVQVGDNTQQLPLNLVGKDGIDNLMWNGKPLLQAFDTKEDWGEISGDIF
jgi:hypothetical protein